MFDVSEAKLTWKGPSHLWCRTLDAPLEYSSQHSPACTQLHPHAVAHSIAELGCPECYLLAVYSGSVRLRSSQRREEDGVRGEKHTFQHSQSHGQAAGRL